MKFMKFIFYALLPIMLLIMLFSYNKSSFLSYKAGASSSTNTINFYGKDNYLIGSYEVPNGNTINDTSYTYISDTNVVNAFPDYLDFAITGAMDKDIILFNDDYTVVAGGCFNQGWEGYMNVAFSSRNVTSINQFSGFKINNFNVNSSLYFDFSLYTYRNSFPTYTINISIYSFDANYNLVNIYPLLTNINDGSFTISIDDVSDFYNVSNASYYYFCINFISDNLTSYNYATIDIEISDANIINYTYDTSPLSTLINNDISFASSNGYIDLQDNYGWSSQSNYNNNFTFDTRIFYDLDLYYLEDNKIFNFSNGWQSTLGEFSNLTFFTDVALKELISDFNTFNTLNFNGNVLHILKTIGLAIANIFNVIISLSELLVAPLIDMVSIIVLLFTKSSFFWTFA